MTYGLTSTGFAPKPQQVIEEELRQRLRDRIDPSLNLGAESVLGQLTTLYAERLAELWQVAASVHQTFDPDVSTGASLDALASLTGTLRRPATRSTVTATVTLDGGATLPAGSVASVVGTDARFRTLEEVANWGGVPADLLVDMEAEETGPVYAPAGTLTQIETPVAGWTAITNALDADLGNNEETDTELRARREQELRRAGAAAAEAIRVDLLDVAGVEAVRVFENSTGTIDADGVPPHAVEAVVLGGVDADVAEALWASKAAGIGTHGSTDVVVTDSEGADHVVSLSRPTEVEVHIAVEVTTDVGYPSDGDTQIAQAIAEWGQGELGIGDDLVRVRLYEIIYDIPGVVDVPVLEAGTSAGSLSAANVTATRRELLLVDTSRITVSSS